MLRHEWPSSLPCVQWRGLLLLVEDATPRLESSLSKWFGLVTSESHRRHGQKQKFTESSQHAVNFYHQNKCTQFSWKLGNLVELVGPKQTMHPCKTGRFTQTRCELFHHRLKYKKFWIFKKSSLKCFLHPTISGISRLCVRFSSMGERSAVWTAVSWQGPMYSGRRNGEAEERS